MADKKSIIDIDINSDKFQAYLEMVNKYRDAVKAIPGEWGKIDEAMEGSKDLYVGMVAALFAQTELMATHLKTQKSLTTQTKATSNLFAGMAKSTGVMVHNVAKVTEKLLKWVGITSALSGLIGAGGLFGIDRLAVAGMAMQKGAAGIGTTPGQQQAFSLNYARYLGSPDAVLGNIADAKSDLSKRWAFGAAGVYDENYRDPTQLGVEMTNRAKALTNGLGPNGLTQQWARAHGLTQFFSMDDLRRIQATPQSELDKTANQTSTAATQLAIPPGVLSAWTTLSITLATAKQNIENTLITALSPLAPAFSDLSKAVTDDLTGVLKNPAFQTGLQNFAKWLDSFAGYLSTPQFTADLKNFGDDIADVAAGLKNALAWLGLIPSKDSTKTGDGSSARDTQPTPTDPNPGWTLPWVKNDKTPAGSMPVPSDDVLYKGFNPLASTIPGVSKGYDFRKAADFFKLPPQLWTDVAHIESDTQAHGKDSPTGAQGMFQFMPAAQKDYQITDPYNVTQETYAFGQYITNLLKKYGSGGRSKPESLAMALAAYNEGPKTLDDQLAADKGGDWFSKLPKDVQNYVRGGSAGVIKISVNNNTGGNAVTTFDQVAQQTQ